MLYKSHTNYINRISFTNFHKKPEALRNQKISGASTFNSEATNMEEFTPNKIEQLNKMPIIESHINKSDDGKWIIQKVTITTIKPVKYFEKILERTEEAI